MARDFSFSGWTAYRVAPTADPGNPAIGPSADTLAQVAPAAAPVYSPQPAGAGATSYFADRDSKKQKYSWVDINLNPVAFTGHAASGGHSAGKPIKKTTTVSPVKSMVTDALMNAITGAAPAATPGATPGAASGATPQLVDPALASRQPSNLPPYREVAAQYSPYNRESLIPESIQQTMRDMNLGLYTGRSLLDEWMKRMGAPTAAVPEITIVAPPSGGGGGYVSSAEYKSNQMADIQKQIAALQQKQAQTAASPWGYGDSTRAQIDQELQRLYQIESQLRKGQTVATPSAARTRAITSAAPGTTIQNAGTWKQYTLPSGWTPNTYVM